MSRSSIRTVTGVGQWTQAAIGDDDGMQTGLTGLLRCGVFKVWAFRRDVFGKTCGSDPPRIL
jgi:hypothetical protein